MQLVSFIKKNNSFITIYTFFL